jgi:large subunit ribosomal protein L10
MVKVSMALDLKKKKVADLIKLIEKSKTIGIVNLEGLPARQLKTVRAKLKKDLQFVFSKKTLLKRAFEGSKRENAKQLVKFLDGINPVVVFSELDAFELFRLFKTSRQMVAAKPGQTAPADITVSAGPTPFAPGPAISELAALGLKTKVEGGKIHIREDRQVIKAGDKISGGAASILAKLGITPIQIGVTLTYVLENNDLYKAAVLDVDIGKYTEDLKTAFLNAVKVAMEIGFATKETIVMMVQRAYRGAKALEDKIAPKATQ